MMSISSGTIHRRTGTLFIAGLNTLFSVLFQLLVVYKLGVGQKSDLYYAVTIVSSVLFTIMFDPLNNILIPMFVERAVHDKRASATLLWNSLAVVLALGGAVALLTYIPLKFLIPALFRSVQSSSWNEIGRVLIVYSAYMVLFGAANVKNCFLFSIGHPVSAQSSILLGWIVSLSIILAIPHPPSVTFIAYCLVGGALASLAFPNIPKWAFTYKKSLYPEHLSTLAARSWPLTSGAIVARGEALVDGVIASSFGVGNLSVFHLFSRFLVSISAVVNSGYIQPVTKDISEVAGHRRWSDLGPRCHRAVVDTVLVSLGMLLLSAIGFVAAPRLKFIPSVYTTLLHNNWPVLLLMSGYLFGSLASKVYATGLIVMRREREFAVLSIGSFMVGALLKVWGGRHFGLEGLGATTSVYWALATAAMAIGFWRRLHYLETRSFHEQKRAPNAPAKHVLFVNKFGFSYVGGVEQHILNLSRELISSGRRVTLLCQHELQHSGWAPPVSEIRIVQISNLPQMVRFFFRERQNIDVCHAHMARKSFALCGLFCARWLGIPTVFTPHCFYPSPGPAWRAAKWLYDSTITPLTFALTDRVINLTPVDQADSIARGLNPHKSVIIPNSVDFSLLENYDPSVSFKSKYGIVDPFLLHVGRYAKEKCIDFLVRNHRFLDTRLALVLIGQDDGELKNISDLVDRERLHDRVFVFERLPSEDVWAAFSEALALVMASRNEGLPTVILEAAFFATPAIAPKVGGIPYVISDRENGLLYNWNDSAGYSSCVNQIQREHKRLSQQVRRSVIDRYSWRSNARKVAAIYDEISFPMDEVTASNEHAENQFEPNIAGAWNLSDSDPDDVVFVSNLRDE